MRRKLIGRRVFGSAVDITDPGYDKCEVYRMDNIAITPGEYACRVWRSNEKYEYDGQMHDDFRVGVVGIYLDDDIPTQKSMERIGSIGVDSGLAGFFENKPDYGDSEWAEFCDGLFQGDNQAWIIDCGFFSESGYGDGMYPVYAAYDKDNNITALEVRFL